MKKARLNVIDVSFALQAQTRRRNGDGIHWSPACNRLLTNITLTHLTLTLPGGHRLPGVMRNRSLNKLIGRARASSYRIREEAKEKKAEEIASWQDY